MNIEHLRLFVRVAATHNISLAGKELGLSAPVASMHINKLEESIGARLIHRTTRKVSLTEEGEALLPYADEILASVDAARSTVGTGKAQATGTIRITAPASFGRMHVIPALKGFLDKHPELSVDIRLTDSMIDMIEGGFDVAIRDADLKDSTLIAKKLATDKRIICASPEYIAAHGNPTSLEELKNHSCVKQMGFDSWTFNTPTGLQNIKLKGRVRVDHGEAVRDAALQSLGVAMCAEWLVYQQLINGSLVEVLTDYSLNDAAAIWAVYPSSRLLAPKVRAFLDYFSEYYGAPPYWEN
ncbi:LysR family transcriptional regulator [Agarivorans aestuarii]|uniref:LysR family transcriptional regulator n=1 Tax=Agarivorans aestuarii TaxID=1563703 RepID=A0ABU7G3N6_9ALTE|nr:LysR family transcriptional regulator [Agarivorans aestuarii]MEE1673943.1 LysR family transcriptional regulator [Agarivorans aestuarii]